MRYGIIGCGNISRFHFNAIKKIGGEITFVADLNEEAAVKWAKEFGAKVTNNYKDVVYAENVDVVCILLSSIMHKEVALEAIRNKKDIICEKTMMNNAKEALEIFNAVKQNDIIFFTSYMKRFFSATIKAKELVQNLGTVFSANVRSYQCWGNFYSDKHGWNIEAIIKGYGGAIVKCAASHMLDMMMYLLGRPSFVYANINFYPQSKFDRKATAIFEYEHDLTVQFEAAAHPLAKIGYERNSWDEFIEISGTNGRLKLSTVMWDNPENNGLLLEYYDNEKETFTEYRFAPQNPFDEQIKVFNKCFEERQKCSPNEADGYNVDKIIESMFDSNNQKKLISINWEI